jgi:hypothetical protein
VSRDQILVWMAHAFDGPFTVLLFLLGGLGVMLYVAQHKGKLDLSQMFKDDAGKESGLRFAILGAWIMSSWLLMSDTVNQKQGDPTLLGIYLATWSGSAIFARLIDKWNGEIGKPGGKA